MTTTAAAQSSADHFFAPPISSLLTTEVASAVGGDNNASSTIAEALDGGDGMHATRATALWGADDVATTKTIGAFADVLAVCCLFALLSRTYVYVARRRKGQVGPGAAPILLKQACVQGTTHSVYTILRLYFAPLQSDWLISLCRFLILLASTVFPDTVYQNTVKRIYIAYKSDLDRTIDQALRKLDEANKALQSFAVDALQIIAVGGVAALFPTLRDAAQQQLQQDEQQKQLHQQQRQKPVAHVSSRGLGGGGDGSLLASVVDGDDNSCSDVTLRPQTHFQQPDERVDAIATALAGQHLNGAIQRSVVQPPKPRYEDAYQMRLQFRRRASVRANKKKNEQQ